MDPVNAMYLTVGLLFLAAAAALLTFNFSDRLNRVFALYLILEGGAMVVYTVPRGDWWQTGLRGMFTWLTLSASFPLLYLAVSYRDRFGRGGNRRLLLAAIVAAALVVLGLHLLDHSFFYGTGARPLRPLHYILILLSPAIIAALLAGDAIRSSAPARRSHLLGASLAFAFYPTAFALHLFIPGLMAVYPLEAWIALTGLAPVIYTVARLVRVGLRTADAKLRLSIRKYLLVLGLSPVSVATLAVVNAAWPEAGPATMRYVMTGWLVVLAGLVGYAILRHQLFGIERGLKWTIQRGTVPGMTLAAFFVVSQVVESLAEAETIHIGGVPSWVVGGVAVVALTLAYRPLQRRVDRFASTTMPEVDTSTEYTAFRKLQIYESALVAVWEDGVLGADERLRLEKLRQRLRISAGDARVLEEEFLRSSQPGRRRVSQSLMRRA